MKTSARILAILFVIAYSFLSVSNAKAALITFNFTGANPGQNSPWNMGTTIDPNATTLGFVLGGGLVGAGANNRFNANSWNTGTTVSSAISGNDYFGFVLTINPGYAANLNGAAVTFTLQSSWTGSAGNGPKNYALFTSIAGFTSGSELQSGTIANTESFTYTFGSSGFDNRTGDIDFRVYGWNAVSSVGTMSANAFSIGGTIEAVPEPTNIALGIFAVSLLAISGGRAWRESRKKLKARRLKI